MPLTDPIAELLIEERESLIPELAPTQHSIVPGIKTNKPLLYPIPGEPENSEQLNLIETAKPPESEFSRAEADAFIINQANGINSIPEGNTSAPATNSTLRDATNSEVDPLIGKLDSDLGDPLTNPNLIALNNVSDDSNKSAADVPPVNLSTATSELNTTADTDILRENQTQLSPTASTISEQASPQKLPVVNGSTTSEQVSPKTPLPATAKTSSKPEDNKTPLPSTATLESESSPNKTSAVTVLTTDKSEAEKALPVTVSTSAQSEPNKTSSTTAPTSDSSEFNQTLVATASTPDITEPNKTSPANLSTPDNSEADKTLPATVSISDKIEADKTLPATVSTTDKSESSTTSPAIVSTSDNSKANTTSFATASTIEESEASQISSATLLNTDKSEANQPLPATASTAENAEPNKTSPATVLNTDQSSANQPSPTITSTTDKLESNKTLPATATASTTDKIEPNTTSPATASTTDKIEPNTTSPATASTSDKIEPNTTSPATASTTDKPEPNKQSPTTASTSEKSESNKTSPTETFTANNLDTAANLEPNKTSTPSTSINFDSNAFSVDEKGIVGIEFTSDGGRYSGQLAIVSLLGMEKFVLGSEAFISEAASRALSNSTKGYIAINDDLESAYYTDANSSENVNSGQYLGTKTFAMTPGDKFFFMLVPNGTVQQVYDNPTIGGDKKPLFSIATDNPSDGAPIGQIADLTGEGKLFVMEDMGVRQGSDRDYNDIIFKITGATSKIASINQFIDSEHKAATLELAQKLIGVDSKAETKTDSIIDNAPSSESKTDSIIDNAPSSESKTDPVSAESDKQSPPNTESIDAGASLETEPTNSDNSQLPKTELTPDVDVQKPQITSIIVNDTAPQQIIEILPVAAEITEQTVAPTDLVQPIFSEQLPEKTDSNVSLIVEKRPQEIDELVPSLVEEAPQETDELVPSLVEEAPQETDELVPSLVEKAPQETDELVPSLVEEAPQETDELVPGLVEEAPQETDELVPSLVEQLPSSNTELPAVTAAEQLSKETDFLAVVSVADALKDIAVTFTTEFETPSNSLPPKSADTPSNSLLLATEETAQNSQKQADNQPVATREHPGFVNVRISVK